MTTTCNSRPKTLAERLSYLVSDARRILQEPDSHKQEEIAWARDMVAAAEVWSRMGIRTT